jgi:hypothetical protein
MAVTETAQGIYLADISSSFYYGDARMINRAPLYSQKNYITNFVWIFLAAEMHALFSI